MFYILGQWIFFHIFRHIVSISVKTLRDTHLIASRHIKRGPVYCRRISGRRFSPSGGIEATTGNASAVRRLIKRRNTCIAQKRLELQHHKNVLLQ